MKGSIIIILVFQIWLICQKMGYIGVVSTWSWWFVLMPVWIPMACIVAVIIIAEVIGDDYPRDEDFY